MLEVISEKRKATANKKLVNSLLRVAGAATRKSELTNLLFTVAFRFSEIASNFRAFGSFARFS